MPQVHSDTECWGISDYLNEPSHLEHISRIPLSLPLISVGVNIICVLCLVHCAQNAARLPLSIPCVLCINVST